MTCVVASAGLSPKLCSAEYHWCNAASCFETIFRSVDRIDVLHESEKTFGECRVDVNGAFQECVRLIRKHEGAEDLHKLATFGCEDGGSKNAVVRSVDNNFH